MQLTILFPCLNEEETIKQCIQDAQKEVKKLGVEAEILVIDNGSTDNSMQIAKECGARVLLEHNRGYGNAIRRGIWESEGDYIIMADADGSYPMDKISDFYESLRYCELVMGNRLNKTMEKGAMPFLHRLGVPFLSWMGRKKYKVKVHDFHCGMRGFNSRVAKTLIFRTTGMEFATEMIHKFSKYRIKEIEIGLRKDGRVNTKKHLRTFRDGFRHLSYILTH